MTILVTGAAGFIGFYISLRLLEKGHSVIGIDNLNAYTDPKLKDSRLAELQKCSNFSFHKIDIAEHNTTENLIQTCGTSITHIAHMAAQAGVRHSLKNPQLYIDSNITGTLNILEYARQLKNLEHCIYASSSSVYGKSSNHPSSIHDRLGTPLSVYAVTKQCAERLAQSYAALYQIPLTALRFFNIYGPWGRPDMALSIFTKRILAGQPITVYNHGNMQRDFTYIDDVVDGILAALNHPPRQQPPHQIYNFGHAQPEKLTDFIAIIETALNKKAIYDFQPIQAGDIAVTCADITETRRDLDFSPKIDIEEGIPRYIDWHKHYYQQK